MNDVSSERRRKNGMESNLEEWEKKRVREFVFASEQNERKSWLDKLIVTFKSVDTICIDMMIFDTVCVLALPSVPPNRIRCYDDDTCNRRIFKRIWTPFVCSFDIRYLPKWHGFYRIQPKHHVTHILFSLFSFELSNVLSYMLSLFGLRFLSTSNSPPPDLRFAVIPSFFLSHFQCTCMKDIRENGIGKQALIHNSGAVTYNTIHLMYPEKMWTKEKKYSIIEFVLKYIWRIRWNEAK